MKTSRFFRLFLAAAGLTTAGILSWLLLRSQPTAAISAEAAAPVAEAQNLKSETVATPAASEQPETRNPRPEAVAAPAPEPVLAALTSHAAPAAPVPVAAAPVVAPQPSAPADEVAATERMYLAHAPLRAPEVSDPDSETNRRILQTMVAKALAVPTAAPKTGTTD